MTITITGPTKKRQFVEPVPWMGQVSHSMVMMMEFATLDIKNLGYAKNGTEGNVFEAVINQPGFEILPNLTGMESGTWAISPALPAGLEFNVNIARSGGCLESYLVPLLRYHL